MLVKQNKFNPSIILNEVRDLLPGTSQPLISDPIWSWKKRTVLLN